MILVEMPEVVNGNTGFYKNEGVTLDKSKDICKGCRKSCAIYIPTVSLNNKRLFIDDRSSYCPINQFSFYLMRTRPLLNCTILYSTILYYTILCYTIQYYTTLYCTVPYYTILYCTVLYCTILYYATLHYTRIIIYSAVLYSTYI